MFLLTHGPQLPLPKGRYVAEFELRWSCGEVIGGRPAAIVHVEAGESLGKVEVPCEGEGDGEYRAVAVEFQLQRRAAVELRVQYVGGEVWHDRTRVWRLDKRAPPAR